MTHPDFTILFVDNTLKSADFYRSLFEIDPVEGSDTFALFVLTNGLKFGLWSRHTVEPPTPMATVCGPTASARKSETIFGKHDA